MPSTSGTGGTHGTWWHSWRVKRFLLGFGSALALVAVIVGALLLSLGRPGAGLEPPAPAPNTAATPPRDLPKGATWLGTVALTSGLVVSPDGRLEDVRAQGSDVRIDGSGLVAGRLAIDATVPFATAAAQVGKGARLSDAGEGRAGISQTLSLLGRDVPVTATGRVSADRGLLLIEPEQVKLGGPSWVDSSLSALARAAVRIRQPVEGVPPGMRLTTVSVTSAGFRVHLEGTSVHIAG